MKENNPLLCNRQSVERSNRQNKQKSKPQYLQTKHHPSDQTQFHPVKPSIKVDYTVHHIVNNGNKPRPTGVRNVVQNCKNKDSCSSTKETILVGGVKRVPKFTGADQSFGQDKGNTSRVQSRVKFIQGRSNSQFISGRFDGSEYCPSQSNLSYDRSIKTARTGNSSTSVRTDKAQVRDARNLYQSSSSVQKLIKSQFQNGKCRLKTSQSMNSKQSNFSKKQDIKNPDSHTLNSERVSTEGSGSMRRMRINSSNSLNVSSMTPKNYKGAPYHVLPSYKQAVNGIKDIMEYEHVGRQFRAEKITSKCNNSSSIKESRLRGKFRAFNEIHEFDFRKKIDRNIGNQVGLVVESEGSRKEIDIKGIIRSIR